VTVIDVTWHGSEVLTLTSWGSETPIRSRRESVILVDEPIEQVAPADIARADRDRLPGLCERRSERQRRALGSPAIVVLDIGPSKGCRVASQCVRDSEACL